MRKRGYFHKHSKCSAFLIRYDSDGRPEACPFSNLDDALHWIPGRDDLCVPSIPLTASVKPARDPSSPKLLICHDMMGGYQKDRFVQGHRWVEFTSKYKVLQIIRGMPCLSLSLSTVVQVHEKILRIKEVWNIGMP